MLIIFGKFWISFFKINLLKLVGINVVFFDFIYFLFKIILIVVVNVEGWLILILFSFLIKEFLEYLVGGLVFLFLIINFLIFINWFIL